MCVYICLCLLCIQCVKYLCVCVYMHPSHAVYAFCTCCQCVKYLCVYVYVRSTHSVHECMCGCAFCASDEVRYTCLCLRLCLRLCLCLCLCVYWRRWSTCMCFFVYAVCACHQAALWPVTTSQSRADACVSNIRTQMQTRAHASVDCACHCG
jgi:hypothetical protein